MARKGMKRASSMAKRSGSTVAKKCKTIASTIRDAEEVPKAVRTMLCDTLVRTFNTYREDRHPFQISTSSLVGTILKSAQGKLQNAIKETEQKKAALDTEAAKLAAANDAAVAASDAAEKALTDSKTAVAHSKTALKDAKTRVHDLESETKHAEADAAAAATKKEKLEALVNDFLPQVKAGTKHGDAAGRHIGKDVASAVDAEFLTCVTRTFSKKVSSWGTFDNIVDQRLSIKITETITKLTIDIAQMAADKETRAANLEAAKGAIGAAEDKAKALEEACATTAAAAKEAEAAAKVATAALKAQQNQVNKAADACKHAEGQLAAFTNGSLAAYTEVEARAAPPPEPEQAAEVSQAPVAPAAPVAAAMAPSVMSSPRVAVSPRKSPAL